MSRAQMLLNGLVQNAGSFRNLAVSPDALARFAGLGERDLKTIGALAGAASGLIQGLASRTANTSLEPGASAPDPEILLDGPSHSNGSHSLAAVAVLSLIAVAGAVAVVGTVSMVALSSNSEPPPVEWL